MNILVINLMRLGDLIQTSPVLRRLRAEYPGARVTLLVMDVFQEAARLLEGVDRLILFPSLTLTAALDGQGGWPEAYRALRVWFAENLSPPPEMVINLTPNLLGAILSAALGSRKIYGLAADRRRGGFTLTPWASYGLIASRARLANPFNLVDLFVRQAGLRPDGAGLEIAVPPEVYEEVGAAIRALGLPPETSLVGILPGASRPERQWPPENFARTAEILRQQHPCHFFVLGSSREAALGEVIRSRLPAGEVTQCQGRTSVAVLAAHLKHLDLLLTNDTGPMHLAAAVGTPVLALFLATARVQDTGPAGRGHIALEPELSCHPCQEPCPRPRCHALLTPEAVAQWGLHLLGQSQVPPPAGAASPSPLRVYGSDIDPLGYQVYLPLARRPLNRRDFWLWVHRLAWTNLLDGRPPEAWRTWLRNTLAGYYFPAPEDPGVAAGQDALAELLDLAYRGREAARGILRLADRGQPVRLQQKVEEIAAVDLALRRLAVGFPELASLVEFFFQEQRRQGESEMVPLARELVRAYTNLHRLGSVFLAALGELATELGFAGKIRPRLAQEMQKVYPGRGNYRAKPGEYHAGDHQ
ncbi:MAG: glycosyltransferase family 9 protein [Deltaproteobacteria bacterium]|nr:glycosyltransferase family 9 protein [Deltaproteobacteria bacterium]